MKQQFSLFRAADNKVCRRKANSRTPMLEFSMVECVTHDGIESLWSYSGIVVGPQLGGDRPIGNRGKIW
jgi:hypothetical protein